MLFNLFATKPYDTGFLDVGAGHKIYYMQVGNPKGKPVLSFHGGPGSGSKASHADSFDLREYRVILFDQRGCGLSTFDNLTNKNTSTETLKDSIKLLNHLDITKKIIVKGGSWGATLALLFTEKYPERVEKLIISQTYLARKRDADWINVDSARLYPDMMDKMGAPHPINQYFHKLIFSNEWRDQRRALATYGQYEHMLGALDPKFEKPKVTDKAVQKLRIFLHYDANGYFIEENQIMCNIRKIRHIPTLIVHNRMDLICPMEQSYEVHKALPRSRLVIVPDKGHGSKKLFKTLKKQIEKFL